VWVIVGIAAVALIVWWVAAAVDGGDDEVTSGEVTSIEETEQDRDQLFEGGEDGIFVEEEEQAPRSGDVLGQAPTLSPQLQGDEPEEIEQFVQWSQRQQQGEVDGDVAAEGMQQLNDAIGAIINRSVGEAEPGDQVGGGPTRQESQQLQQHQQTLGRAIQQLEQAQQAQEGEAFREAANTAAQTLQYLQRQAQLDRADRPVEQLQQRVQQIRVDQPLSEQGEQIHAFFDQSAQVVEQINQSLQGPQTGGGPTQQD
jgi:hypothetical protein